MKIIVLMIAVGAIAFYTFIYTAKPTLAYGYTVTDYGRKTLFISQQRLTPSQCPQCSDEFRLVKKL
jgi:hypothetical protein